MAASTKKAAAKKASGKAMVNWKDELRRRAAIASATEASTATGGNYFSLRGGILSFNGNTVPGNKMNCIILDSAIENAWYEDDFDPENPVPPDCFAIGRDEKALAPHENSEQPQGDEETGKCEGCPLNEWGSAAKGRGKACKNLRRLALLPEDALEHGIDEAQVAFLKVPVMSVRNWATYVRKLEGMETAPIGVLTEVSLVPDAKSQFRVNFKLVEELDEEHMEALFAKADENEETLLAPYTKRDEEAEEAPPRRESKVRRSGKAKPAAKKVAARKRR